MFEEILSPCVSPLQREERKSWNKQRSPLDKKLNIKGRSQSIKKVYIKTLREEKASVNEDEEEISSSSNSLITSYRSESDPIQKEKLRQAAELKRQMFKKK